jgi:hypothetical protein
MGTGGGVGGMLGGATYRGAGIGISACTGGGGGKIGGADACANATVGKAAKTRMLGTKIRNNI